MTAIGIASVEDNKMSGVNYVFHLLLYHAVARHLPASTMRGGRVWRAFRYWVCRPLFIRCGEDVNVEHGALIGRRSVSIGSHSGIGINAFIGFGTEIGENVMMGPDVLIYTQNHSFSRTDIPMIQQGMSKISPVRIEDDVWIGGRVIVLPGVTIGRGSILGAGAVIPRNVPPYAVVVGNPGRIVRYRNSSPDLEVSSTVRAHSNH